MATYANQKTFTIKRNIVNKNTTEVYLCIYEKSLEKAMIELNGVAFKMYIYLMMNANDYTFDFHRNTYKINITLIEVLFIQP